MSEVPDDLMKVAREVIVGISNDIGGGWIDEAATKVASALAAERERCAAIAQDFIAPMAGLGQAAAANAAMNIAAAILARP